MKKLFIFLLCSIITLIACNNVEQSNCKQNEIIYLLDKLECNSCEIHYTFIDCKLIKKDEYISYYIESGITYTWPTDIYQIKDDYICVGKNDDMRYHISKIITN